jgi:hypothetical protein
MKRHILCLAFFFTFTVSVYGQVTGLPPFGSLDRVGAETRNNQDLNVLIGIPIMSSPGRGGSSLDFSLVYNSDMWSNGGSIWLPNPSANLWGWTTSFGTGQITWKYTTSQRICNHNVGDVTYIYTWTYNNYQFIDNFGTVHKFNLSWQEVQNDCLGTDTTTGTFTSYATDGSGLLAQISQVDPTLYGVRTRGGIYLTPSSIMDRNGNITSASNPQSGETDWTDKT